MDTSQFPDWEETEVHSYRQSFLRAFGDHKADFVMLTDRRNIFLMQGIKWAVEKELLYFDEAGSLIASDEQSTVMVYRQTVQGALDFGCGTGAERGRVRLPVRGEVGERVLLRRTLEFMSAEFHNPAIYRLCLEPGTQLDIVHISQYNHDLHDLRVAVRIVGTPFVVKLLKKDIEGTP